MKCSNCGNNKGGAYRDYAVGCSFNVCLKCCKELGFIPNHFDSMKKCSSCGEYFTPKAKWQKSCIDCWLKSNPSKKKSFTFTKIKSSQKTLGEIYNGRN